MNRVDFQAWLEQFPPETEILVGIQQEAPMYCPYGYVAFDIFKGIHFEDYWYSTYGDKKPILHLGDSK